MSFADLKFGLEYLSWYLLTLHFINLQCFISILLPLRSYLEYALLLETIWSYSDSTAKTAFSFHLIIFSVSWINLKCFYLSNFNLFMLVDYHTAHFLKWTFSLFAFYLHQHSVGNKNAIIGIKVGRPSSFECLGFSPHFANVVKFFSVILKSSWWYDDGLFLFVRSYC